MDVAGFFDAATSTLSYVVYDLASKDAVVIDSVWDYDAASGKLSEESLGKLVDFVRTTGLTVRMVLETHPHADHLSAAQRLKNEFRGAVVAIGSGITKVQALVKDTYGMEPQWPTDGRQFDRLLDDGEVVNAGSLTFKVIHTPGHTPACACYLFGERFLFTGDAMFMPTFGAGRCDFPGGDADVLYASVFDKLYRLPDDVRVYVGHVYPGKDEALVYQTTIGEQKRANVQLKLGTERDEFVARRRSRDATLSAPKLLHPAVQHNVNAGRLPEGARRFFRIPITTV